MTRMNPHTKRGLGSGLRWSVAVVASTVLLGACSYDDLLEVEDIDVTRPGALLDPANLTAVRGLGVGDFSVAFGGAGTSEGVVGLSGVTADEFQQIGSWQWIREADTRIIAEDNPGVTTVFRGLHKARASTAFAIQAYEQNAPNTAAHAEQINLHAYTYVFFAENFCSGVPFSSANAGVYTFGVPLPTDSIFNRAITTFDRALTVATAANNFVQQSVARIGKARALVGLNRYGDAAALLINVPTNFVYNMEYSANTGRQNNGVFSVSGNRREYGLSNLEGGNGVAFRQSPADPRVPWILATTPAFDTMLRSYEQRKYPDRAAPIALASGVEARLIRAEAALDRGNSTAYLDHLNALRSTINLPDLSDPGTPAARVDQYFTERALWLFGTGNRMSDLRRLVRQYGRNQAAVFPTGAYTRDQLNGMPTPSGTYGTDVNWPVPFDERNNPNFNGCLNRSA